MKNKLPGISRRAFAGIATGAVLTAQDRRERTPAVPPFDGPLAFKKQPVASRVEPFPLGQVRLSDGPCQQAREWNTGYMRRLDADRLLHNFRVNAGLPSTAEPLGGWEEPKGELRGHFTGHYLSAAALLHASTGNQEIKTKADYMVAELAKCQEKLGGGYLSAFPREFWDRLDARQKVWAPFYTIHKIMAGMFDMHGLAGNRQALTVLQGMAGWADDWSAGKSEEHMQDILTTEYGGMNEVLYNLAAVTGDDRWGRVGDRFTKKKFFNPLADRRDELRGLHVNTHIPQVIGAARRYELTGDARFHDVADFFHYEVVNARTYATGGTSNGEDWITQPRHLAAELKQSVATAECCCSYNMLKLTRHLYGWTADPRYFDYYERALVNHRLGTIYPGSGATLYYLSLTPGTWKTFATEDKSFWCCTGTGVEEFSKLNDSIYWQDERGVFVNLFIASELNWSEKGVRIRQTTRFPEEAGTALAIIVEKPVRFELRLRVPAWTSSVKTLLNGKELEVSANPGSYLTIARTWKNGDRVQMEMPMQLRTEAMPDDPNLRAILYGPVVLAGDLGTEGLTPDKLVGSNSPRPDLAAIPVPRFQASKDGLPSWIRPAGKPLTFRTSGQERDVTLQPVSSIFDRRYSVYWNFISG